MNEIIETDVKPQLVLGVRRKGKYTDIAQILPELYEFVVKCDIEIQGPPVFVCHETADEVCEANEKGTADLEICIPVNAKINPEKDYKCYELNGGKMARIVHKGPYEECGPAYQKLFDWIKEKEMVVTGPTREVYLNDPRKVVSEEILTEIYAPVE